MVTPHHKDNLEPLGRQGAQRLGMVMAFVPLAAVVELGPLTVVERDKRKPVHRVAQMFVASEAEKDHMTLATGLSHRHRSRLGLKMARGFPATRSIAQFGPDRRHQGSAFPARQRLGHLGRRARGEKTLNLVVVGLHRFDRSSELIDKHLDQLRFGSDHMLGHRQLRLLKLLPQLFAALLAQRMLLCSKAVELFTFKRAQMSRGRIAREKIQSHLGLDILKDLQGPGVVLFERGGELVEQSSLVAHHSALIPTQHLKLLGVLRARSQRFQVRLIGSEKLRQYVSIKGIALRAAHPIAIPDPVHRLGIDRIHFHPVIEQKVHDASRRLLNGRPQLKALGSLLIEPAPDLGQTLDGLWHFHLSYLLALVIADIHLMQAVSPIHPYVVSLHCRLFLRYVIPIPIALNGKLALYRSSKRGLLSIEPLNPFSYWPGQSLPDPSKNRIGWRWSSTSKLLLSVSHNMISNMIFCNGVNIRIEVRARVRANSMHKKITRRAFCSMLLALPFPARAQQPKKVPRLGYLSALDPARESTRSEGIRLALRERGYIEGQNIAIEYRYTEGKLDRAPELAAELVSLKVDIIVVAGGDTWIRSAKNATKTIPIVMTGQGADPVDAGLVESLARPGGNVTGITNLTTQLGGKRLELFKEAVPKLARVAVLYEPASPNSVLELKEVQTAARALRLTLRSLEVRAADGFEKVFAALNTERPDGLYVSAGPQMTSNEKRIVDFALKSRLSSVYIRGEFVDAGGLMSYGADQAESYRRVAYYVDRILKGAKPADMPVEQPMKFELVINLKTAKQIGVTIAPEVLARATRLIK